MGFPTLYLCVFSTILHLRVSAAPLKQGGDNDMSRGLFFPPDQSPHCPSLAASFPLNYTAASPEMISWMITEFSLNQGVFYAYDCTTVRHVAGVGRADVNACNITLVASVGIGPGTGADGNEGAKLLILDLTDLTRGVHVYSLLSQALSMQWLVLLLGLKAKSWVNTLQILCTLQPTWNANYEDGAGYLYPLVTNITLPPRYLPSALYSQYTLNGRVGYEGWYWQNALLNNGTAEVHVYSTARVQDMQEIARQRLPYKVEYPGLDVALYALLDAHPIEGKVVLIMGSTEPWYEAVALQYGASQVVVVEYGSRDCQHPQLRCIHPNELLSAGQRYDVAFSFSSFEHDGLGRYGDPLDPEGDLKAMAYMRDTVLTEDGVMYLNVPIGPDYLWWNAGRVYGELRWPLLVAGWDVLAHAGYTESFLTQPLGHWKEAVWLLMPTKARLALPADSEPLST